LPPGSVEPPIFWIVAGPNGSGKSSTYQTYEYEASARSIWIINPDLLTARLQEEEGLALYDANLQAVLRIEAWLDASIRAHQSVGGETVLSTDKYRRLVTLAKGLRFQIRLTYVILDSPQRCIERVRFRVTKGGHAVPVDKIVEVQRLCRRERTDQLAIVEKFFAMCSAPRSDTAISVLVGLTAPSVGNRPPPAM
jgi:predicted ABC-type ATPase